MFALSTEFGVNFNAETVLSVSDVQHAKSASNRSFASVMIKLLIPLPAGYTALGFLFHFLIEFADN